MSTLNYLLWLLWNHILMEGFHFQLRNSSSLSHLRIFVSVLLEMIFFSKSQPLSLQLLCHDLKLTCRQNLELLLSLLKLKLQHLVRIKLKHSLKTYLWLTFLSDKLLVSTLIFLEHIVIVTQSTVHC